MKIAPKHLPEIDGLRAVAVLAVVLYHAGVPGFTGGYLGVDIFFVISGYLITGLLHHEGQHAGRIDFAAFYARRFRRLLPALAVVLAATLLAASLILFPAELPRLGKSATAVALMFSNLHFMQYSGGYFDPAVDVMPLLHTWSLSVEEQFYFVWPLLLAGCFALARRRGWNVDRLLAGTLALAALASFAYWFSKLAGNPTAAFYLMPARVWELALGGLINFLPGAARHQRQPAGWLRVASLVALAVIGLTLLLPLDPERFAALAYPAAVLATMALIYAIHRHSTAAPVAALLKHKAAIHIGLVSYSFYLWHWPLLALGRAYYLGERLLWRDLTLVAAALLLAFVTYRWLETPVRRKRPWPFAADRTTIKAALALILAAVALAHGVKEAGKTLNERLNRQLQAERTASGKPRLDTDFSKCDEPLDGQTLAPRTACLRGTAGGPTRLVAWGDSYAGHLEGLLYPLAREHGQQYLLRAFGACPPLLDAAPIKGSAVQLGCGRRNQLILDEIRELAKKDLKVVVLGGRWNSYLALPETNPAAMASYALVDDWPRIAAEHPALREGVAPADHAGSLRTLGAALRRTLETLSAMDLEVLLIAPIPEPYANVPHCLYRKSEADCNFARQRADERRRDTVAILQAAAAGLPRVHYVDFIDYFCDATTCRVKQNGTASYWDATHMTLEMGAYLGEQTRSSLGWLWGDPPRR